MFTRYGKCQRPQHCRHVGVPYRMGVNGAHNTVRENVGANNIVLGSVVPGRSHSTISIGAQSTDLGIAV